MEKFEYKFLQIATDGNWQIQVETLLNKLGDEGWELVNFQLHGYLSLIFKRKK